MCIVFTDIVYNTSTDTVKTALSSSWSWSLTCLWMVDDVLHYYYHYYLKDLCINEEMETSLLHFELQHTVA